MIAAVDSSTAAASAASSPYGTTVTSPGSGLNGSCFAGCAVRASAPIVRPWKELCATTMRVRPVRRAILKAASFASAPELQKNTRADGSPTICTSLSASRMAGSVACRLLVWPIVDSWSVTASTRRGSA